MSLQVYQVCHVMGACCLCPQWPLGTSNKDSEQKCSTSQWPDFTMSHMLRITSYNTNYDGQGFFPIHHHSTQQGNPNFKLHSIEIPCAMTLTAWQPDSLIDSLFFPKVPRRRQRMGCPTIRRHKDSCTSLKKFSKLRIEVEQRAKDKLQNPTIFEDQHLVRHLTPGFNLLDPDRWKSAKIQVCTRRQASLDQCPVRNHRDLNVTKS